jgi:hypothetical protein
MCISAKLPALGNLEFQHDWRVEMDENRSSGSLSSECPVEIAEPPLRPNS